MFTQASRSATTVSSKSLSSGDVPTCSDVVDRFRARCGAIHAKYARIRERGSDSAPQWLDEPETKPAVRVETRSQTVSLESKPDAAAVRSFFADLSTVRANAPTPTGESKPGRPSWLDASAAMVHARDVTAGQLATLRAIAGFLAEGVQPSLKDLGDLLGSDPSYVRTRAIALVRRGFLSMERRKHALSPRGKLHYTITPAGEALL